MQDLHLVGFTKDHRRLIFSTRKDAKSGSYVVPVDDDLLEAVEQVVKNRPPGKSSAEEPEPVPAAPRVESQLSVREVQSRLRAGEAISVVASEAGVDPAWVERFSAPIRAEQRRIVDRALTIPLTRPRAGLSAVPLRRAIAAAMYERGIDFSAEGFESAWSAHLVGGDEWIVAFEFPNRGRKRRLEWMFDLGDGTLTTNDRFASQLAFVEDVHDLPPAGATVGASPARVASPLPRGALTSGGLARPGSGRVTTPSTSAADLPPVVRPSSPPPPPPSAPPAPERRREEISDERRPVSPPPQIDQDPIPLPSRPPAPQRPPAAQRAPEPPPHRPEPQRSPMIRERQPVPAAERPAQPRPVVPRRPAPVAATTNASSAYSRRGIPEPAERVPVVVDSPRSHPPGRGESVVILRPTDESADEPTDDYGDEFPAQYETGEVLVAAEAAEDVEDFESDEPSEHLVEDHDEDADDDYDEVYEDEVYEDEVYEDASYDDEQDDESYDDDEYEPRSEFSITLSIPDEDFEDESYDDDFDDADDHDGSHEDLDVEDLDDLDPDDEDLDEYDSDEASTVADLPVRTPPRRQLIAEPLDPDDPEADDLEPAPRRASTIQIRPGSATQAAEGSNGRRHDRSDAPDENPAPPPRRRRRSQPLRAR